MPGWHDASEGLRLSGSEFGKRSFGKVIELGTLRVGLDQPVPPLGLKRLKPGGKGFELGGIEFRDGFSICSSFVMAPCGDTMK